MAFTLQPLSYEDAARCVDVYFAAFQNPHSLGCWPRDVATVRAWWEKMIRDELTEPGAHWFKAVDTSTNEIAGFVKWMAPRPGTFPETQLPTWPEGADIALCDKTFGAWAGKHRELMQDRGHWCK